jgi:sugar lactone lactonase YvrE
VQSKAELFIDSRNQLGEGPFWHPDLRRLFWFDILGQKLFAADAHGRVTDAYSFDAPVSAAGIIDRDTLAVASAGAMLRLDLRTKATTVLAPLEADKPGNRPNDGRVNLAGGLWIGTMSRQGGKEKGLGAVYQFRSGRVEMLFDNITIPNSACFAPDGRTAYFADSDTKTIRKCRIDPSTGRPLSEWTDFASIEVGVPDGSVVDSAGYVWNAQFNGSKVVRYAPDGSIDRIVELPVSKVTCPAFGGDDLKTLFITTARENMTAEELAREPHAGSVFSIRVDVPGQPEPLLKL